MQIWDYFKERRLRQGKRRMRKRRRQAFRLSTCIHRQEQRDRTQKTSSLLLDSQKERRRSYPTQRNSHAAASLQNTSLFQSFNCNFLRHDMLRDTESLYFPIERFNLAIFIRILMQMGAYSALLLSHRYLHSLNSFKESSFRLILRQNPLNSYFFFNNFSSSGPKISVKVFMESFNCQMAFSQFSCVRKYSAKLSQMRLMVGTFPVQKMSSSIFMKARSKAQLCLWDYRSQLMAERTISQLSCVGISVVRLWQMRMFSPYAVQGCVLESWMFTLDERYWIQDGIFSYSSLLMSIYNYSLFSCVDWRFYLICTNKEVICQYGRQYNLGLHPERCSFQMALVFLKRMKVVFMLILSLICMPSLQMTEYRRQPGRMLSVLVVILYFLYVYKMMRSQSWSLSLPFPKSLLTSISMLSVTTSQMT